MAGPISTSPTQSPTQAPVVTRPARNFAEQDQFKAAKPVQVALVCCMQVEQLKDLNAKLAEIRAAGINADPDTVKFVQDRLSKLLTDPAPYLIGVDQQNWVNEVKTVLSVAAADAKLLSIADNFASQLAIKMSLPIPFIAPSPVASISGVAGVVSASESLRPQTSAPTVSIQPSAQIVVQPVQAISVAAIGGMNLAQRSTKESSVPSSEGTKGAEAALQVTKDAPKGVLSREETSTRSVVAALNVPTTSSKLEESNRSSAPQQSRTLEVQSSPNLGTGDKISGATASTTESKPASRTNQAESGRVRDEVFTQSRGETVRPGVALAMGGTTRVQEAVVNKTVHFQPASQQGLGSTSQSITARPSSTTKVDTQFPRVQNNPPADRSARPQVIESRIATVEPVQRVGRKDLAATPQRDAMVNQTRVVRQAVPEFRVRGGDPRSLAGSHATTTARYNNTIRNQAISAPPLRSLHSSSVQQPLTRRIAREGSIPIEQRRRSTHEPRTSHERILSATTATPLHVRQLHLQNLLRVLRTQGLQENSRGAQQREVQQREVPRRLQHSLAISEKATKLLHRYADLPVKELVRLNVLHRDQKQKTLSPSERLAQRGVRVYLQQLRSILAQLLSPNSLLYKRVTSELSISDLEMLVELLAGRKARRALRKKMGQGLGGEVTSEDLTTTVLESLANEEDGTTQTSAAPQPSATVGPSEEVEGNDESEALSSGQFVAEGATPKASLTTVMMKDDSSLPASNG